MNDKGFFATLLGMVGSSIRYLLVGIGSLVLLLVVVALLTPDSEGSGNAEQRDSVNQRGNIVTRFLNGGKDNTKTSSGYDNVLNNPDADMDVRIDEQSTVVLGE